MATLPTPKRRKSKLPDKSKRTHVPPLPPDKLQTALDKLATLPISPEGRKAIADTLKAASNPNAERIDVVIRTLPKERKKLLSKTVQGLRALNAEVMARGKTRLEKLSDDEWQRLVDDSLNG